MLIIRRYKKSRAGNAYWEYKIYYKDNFTRKKKCRSRNGFHSRIDAEAAASEMMGYLRLVFIER